MSRVTPKSGIYQVRKGDTLWDIAKLQYGDPLVWEEISKANRLKNPDLVLVGQKLRLPTLNRPSEKNGGSRFSPGANSRASIGAFKSTAVRSGKVTARAPSRAVQKARPVMFPTFKFTLDDLPSQTISTPFITYTLRLTGQLLLQKKGYLTDLTFSRTGAETSLQKEARDRFSKLTSGVKVAFDTNANRVDLSYELAVSSKAEGGIWSTTKFEVLPPNGFKFVYEPQPVVGSYNGFKFKGQVGYQVELRMKAPPPPSMRVPVPSPEMVRETGKWVAIGLFVGAGVVAVGTIVEDVLTGGAGVLDDAVSFSVAAGLFNQGAAAFAH